MKYYDFNKVKEIIAKQDDLNSALLGMHEDWFWTAEIIFEDGKYINELNEDTKIGGINGSRWATPTLQLIFNDGTDKMIEVSIGENTCSGEGLNWSNGCLSGPVQRNITPLSKE